jgi:hypothetical protein
VNDEWSAVETMRHLVVRPRLVVPALLPRVAEPFTPMGLGPTSVPDRTEQGSTSSAAPSLDEVLAVRDAQAAELEAWLRAVTAEQLAGAGADARRRRWPPYARGRSVRQCLGTVLNEEWEHHGSACATST